MAFGVSDLGVCGGRVLRVERERPTNVNVKIRKFQKHTKVDKQIIFLAQLCNNYRRSFALICAKQYAIDRPENHSIDTNAEISQLNAEIYSNSFRQINDFNYPSLFVSYNVFDWAHFFR